MADEGGDVFVSDASIAANLARAPSTASLPLEVMYDVSFGRHADAVALCVSGPFVVALVHVGAVAMLHMYVFDVSVSAMPPRLVRRANLQFRPFVLPDGTAYPLVCEEAGVGIDYDMCGTVSPHTGAPTVMFLVRNEANVVAEASLPDCTPVGYLAAQLNGVDCVASSTDHIATLCKREYAGPQGSVWLFAAHARGDAPPLRRFAYWAAGPQYAPRLKFSADGLAFLVVHDRDCTIVRAPITSHDLEEDGIAVYGERRLEDFSEVSPHNVLECVDGTLLALSFNTDTYENEFNLMLPRQPQPLTTEDRRAAVKTVLVDCDVAVETDTESLLAFSPSMGLITTRDTHLLVMRRVRSERHNFLRAVAMQRD